ncbi:MAG: glycosyltransferase [Chthoniobacterales bacterium]
MRIVFASIGSLGDLHPLLAVAKICRERGHEVRIAASPFFQDYIAKLGFEGCPLRPALEPNPKLISRLGHSRRGPERLFRDEIFPAVRETYQDLCESTRQADIFVVGELLYIAPLVARTNNLPWANAILSPSSFLSVEDPCVLAPAPWLYPLRRLGTWPQRTVLQIGRQVTSHWAKPLFDLRRELGFPNGPSPIFEGKYSPDCVLTFFPDFFAPPQTDWPKKIAQVGFPFFEQPASPELQQQIQSFQAAGDPPIVFTLGSTAVHMAQNFYSLAQKVSQALGRRAILLTGENSLDSPPDKNILSIPYAPLSLVLQKAAAVVHHGGIGSCAEGLRAGIPALVIPFGYDQPDNAQRLVRLGVAVIGKRSQITFRHLKKGLEKIFQQPGMIKQARSLAQQIAPDKTLRLAVDNLENIIPG